jgi:O-antigen ligase
MKRYFSWFFSSFVFTIPIIPIEFNVKLLILAIFLSFFLKRNSDFRFWYRFNQTWPIIFYFVIVTIGIFYSKDRLSGLGVLETNFSFLGIAILPTLYNDKISSNEFNWILRLFIAGVLLASVLSFTFAVINYHNSGNVESLFFYKLTRIINSHPTYFAYYIIFSITVIFYELISSRLKKNTAYWLLLFAIFLFVILILTGGRTSFISLLLISSFFLLKAILSEDMQHRLELGVLSTLIIIGIFFTGIFQESIFGQNSNDTTWERMDLWKAAINANQNYILGVGTGDYKSVLNEYYSEHDLKPYAIQNYNSHNQFIQIFFSNGILGLITVLFLIGRPLILAIKHDHVLGILIFFPFLIYGMTEVFLGRYQGVVFFALFHQLFVCYYLDQTPPIVKERGH